MSNENRTYECMGMYCTEKLSAPGTCSRECGETVPRSLPEWPNEVEADDV